MPKNAAKTEPKTRMRVVSLRIPDDSYEIIRFEATRLNISPSKLMTNLIQQQIKTYYPDSIGETPLHL